MINIEKKRATWRRWYYKHKDKARASRKKGSIRLKEWFIEYKKAKCCQDCGNNDPRVLVFHHRDPSTKKGDVSVIALRGTKTQLLAEIAKCDVLCANRHSILHYEERNP